MTSTETTVRTETFATYAGKTLTAKVIGDRIWTDIDNRHDTFAGWSVEALTAAVAGDAYWRAGGSLFMYLTCQAIDPAEFLATITA